MVCSLLLCLYKILHYRQVVIKEWSHPIKISFMPTVSTSLLMLPKTLNAAWQPRICLAEQARPASFLRARSDLDQRSGAAMPGK